MDEFYFNLPIWFIADPQTVTVDQSTGTVTWDKDRIGLLSVELRGTIAVLAFTDEDLACRYNSSHRVVAVTFAISTDKELKDFLVKHLPREFTHLAFDVGPNSTQARWHISRHELLDLVR